MAKSKMMTVLNRGGREFTLRPFEGWEGTEHPIIKPNDSMDVPYDVGAKLVKDYPRELVDTATYSPARADDNAGKDAVITSLREENSALQAKVDGAADAQRVAVETAKSDKDKEHAEALAELADDKQELADDLGVTLSHLKDVWASLKAYAAYAANIVAKLPEGTERDEAPEVPEIPEVVQELDPEAFGVGDGTAK